MNEPIPMPPIEEEQLWDLMCRAEEMGLRLELLPSGFTWEASLGWRHQTLEAQINRSIRPAAGSDLGSDCCSATDLWIRFPDGTAKRPDIAIFCRTPADEEGFVHDVPEAVVEFTSPGYEGKDLVAGYKFYLEQGVKDVLVLDRRTMETHHWGPEGHSITPSPATFELTCGCSVIV